MKPDLCCEVQLQLSKFRMLGHFPSERKADLKYSSDPTKRRCQKKWEGWTRVGLAGDRAVFVARPAITKAPIKYQQ